MELGVNNTGKGGNPVLDQRLMHLIDGTRGRPR